MRHSLSGQVQAYIAVNKPSLKDLREAKKIVSAAIRRVTTYQPVESIEDLRAMAYNSYLKTEHWAQVRTLKLREQKYRCQRCFKPNGLQIHHLTYKHLGEEQDHLEDLTVFCGACHKENHGI